jgi:FtsZ-interacting cell division protein YlmF
MNQTVLSYLHLLVWPTLVLFIVLKFQSTIRYLLHERLTRIDAGGISAQFEKATREAIDTASPKSAGVARQIPKIDLEKTARVAPKRYEDVREVAERFRAGQPVLLDVTGLNDNDARRIIDFAAGGVFQDRGSLYKVTNKVFLLTPYALQ